MGPSGTDSNLSTERLGNAAEAKIDDAMEEEDQELPLPEATRENPKPLEVTSDMVLENDDMRQPQDQEKDAEMGFKGNAVDMICTLMHGGKW